MENTNNPIQNSGDLAGQISKHLRETRLLESRSIFLSDAVTSGSAARVIADLLILDQESDKPIYLYINSPGGEVNSGFAIFDTIRFINSEVYCITAGLCASIATIINISVSRDKRLAFPNAKYLIHQPLISGVVQGQASDLEITATQIIKTRAKLNGLLAEECGQKLARIEEDTLRDYWMTAAEAKDYGLVGKIIESKKELK